MRTALLFLFSFNLFAAPQFICEDHLYNLTIEDASFGIVEEEGMNDIQMTGKMIVKNKGTGETLIYSHLFATYNEFNEYSVAAMIHDDGEFKEGFKLNFYAEEGNRAEYSALLPKSNWSEYQGYSEEGELDLFHGPIKCKMGNL